MQDIASSLAQISEDLHHIRLEQEYKGWLSDKQTFKFLSWTVAMINFGLCCGMIWHDGFYQFRTGDRVPGVCRRGGSHGFQLQTRRVWSFCFRPRPSASMIRGSVSLPVHLFVACSIIVDRYRLLLQCMIESISLSHCVALLSVSSFGTC